MLLLAMTMGYSSLKACHEGDFGALNKGHYKWGEKSGYVSLYGKHHHIDHYKHLL